MKLPLSVLAVIAVLALSAGRAQAERLLSTLSTDTVEITSSFDGESISLFGTIEPDTGSIEPVPGQFHVIIVIEGPTTDRVARRKTNRFGIWINTEQVLFDNFPSYFQVLSSGRLRDITSETTLAVENILPEAQARHSAEAGWWNSVVYGRELVRLMTEKGAFGISENAVHFLSRTAYTARVALPGDVPNGPFIARTYVFRDGEIIARTAEGFSVRKIGFERFIGLAAVQYPLLYGLAGVALALFTGWLGGVVFKR